MSRTILLSPLLVVFLIGPASAQSPTPAYIVLGDSVEFGLGDDIAADGMGYVPLVTSFLTMFVGTPVDRPTSASRSRRRARSGRTSCPMRLWRQTGMRRLWCRGAAAATT